MNYVKLTYKHSITLLLLVLFSSARVQINHWQRTMMNRLLQLKAPKYSGQLRIISENINSLNGFRMQFGIFIHWGIFYSGILVPNGMLLTCICRIAMNINIMSRNTVIL